MWTAPRSEPSSAGPSPAPGMWTATPTPISWWGPPTSPWTTWNLKSAPLSCSWLRSWPQPGPRLDHLRGRILRPLRFALHRAGDVDADGFADVIVGAYLLGTNGDLEHQPDEGGAYVFSGSRAGLELTPTWSAFGSKADAWFGYSLGTAGDINGDEAADILVGSPNYKIR